jgi:hypothetical protein
MIFNLFLPFFRLLISVCFEPQSRMLSWETGQGQPRRPLPPEPPVSAARRKAHYTGRVNRVGGRVILCLSPDRPVSAARRKTPYAASVIKIIKDHKKTKK